jgi:dTDP-4-amino-4,6-dideoxygalactose transaminase
VIPFVDLKAQYRSIQQEVNAAIQGVLESCAFTLGSEVQAFEAEFASYSQAAQGIGVNNGTSALHLALLAAKIGPGDEVITVPFTFVASVARSPWTRPRSPPRSRRAPGLSCRCTCTGRWPTWIPS